MVDTSKIIQALCFILNELPNRQADKVKLVKLLYLADKCHLIRYGRTISGDEFWAMPWGPVGSVTKDILDFDEEEEKYFPNQESKYAAMMLQRIGTHAFAPKTVCNIDNIDQLSETDIEALRLVAKLFGHWDNWELVDYTHRYAEWDQYKELFESNQIKRERIYTEELLSVLPDDPLAMPDEHIEESRNILTGFSS